ncbi:MAG: ribose 5-phosphate isomerase B [Candidatus Cloacimonetes bacterium]|nr:ribose 5-phosphate isomerase B [Candidatus Cloacimonadota bacterium]MCF7813374.1 ribose 5-phosphate isomerase B [Candidatus Cloacimonadota bacterium]MCF7867501.1 ribose 5-phosphate isomerase B [Candidatus Cloacimonadota bacterium]MCF7882996.1 ribose 5-phosphate isomerase B [Candidatus Cloacimonadota bacterium]
MKIAIASDHAGYELKEAIKEYLSDHEIKDFGTHSLDSMDYPDTGFVAAKAVAKGECKRGILICGSGIGMSIVANKVPGIRAALCHTVQYAQLSRMHNNANILILAGRFISKYLAKDIIDTWLTTEFEGNRHQKRIDKITKYESK